MTRPRDILSRVGVDLSAAGREPPPTYGEQAVSRVLDHLDRRRSVLLVGPLGVGKTALVHGVAQAMARRGAGRLLQVPTAEFLATTDGPWQARAVAIARQAAHDGVVVYVPDIENAPTASASPGPGLVDVLRPAMETEGLVLLAEATPRQLHRLQSVHRFATLFHQVPVEPLSRDQAAAALYHAADGYGLAIDHETCEALLGLAGRFFPRRPLPGPALDLLGWLAEAHRRDSLDSPLTPATVEAVLSARTGLPPVVVSPTTTRRAAEIRAWFEDRIVGQPEAVNAVIELIALYKAGLVAPDRPVATLLFAGSPGTGRLEMARTLATWLYSSPRRLLRIDLADHTRFDSDTALRLACLDLHRQPFQVLVLEHLDLAHPSAWAAIRTLLSAAEIEGPAGEPVSLGNAVVIATTEVGAVHAGKDRDHLVDALEGTFGADRLALFNRVVGFAPLNRDQARAAVRQVLSLSLSRAGLDERGITVDADDSVIDLVIERGLGERHDRESIARRLEAEVVVPVALTLLERATRRGQVLQVAAHQGHVRVRIADPEPGDDDPGEEMTFPFAGPLVSRQSLAESIARCRADVDALARAVDEPALEAARRDLLERRRDSGFWRDHTEAARALRDLDRVTVVLDRIRTLRHRTDNLGEELRGADTRPRLDRLSGQLRQVEAAVVNAWRELVHMGSGGHWDAIVEVRPETAGPARDALVNAYHQWAQHRRMEWTWISEPLAPHEPALFVVSGRYAFGMLRMETGRHLVRDAEGQQGAALVRVAAWTDLTREPQVTSVEALTAVGAFGGDVRTRVRCKGGLVLQNAFSPAVAQDLAAKVAGSWSHAPPAHDDLVRTYDLAAPLVTDALSGIASNRPDAMGPERLHELLCLRIDHVAAQWTVGDQDDDPTEA